MITLPATKTLLPEMADGIYCFPSGNTELVKIDFLFEAGSAYQTSFLCAAAANKLLSVATKEKDSAQLAEFLDYRGVVVETTNGVQQSVLTVYMLRRFAEEVMPVLGEMLRDPAFDRGDFEVWKERKRVELGVCERQTRERARRLFYECLMGAEHPLGRHASGADVDALRLETVKEHYRKYYSLTDCTVVVSGRIDDYLLALVERYITTPTGSERERELLPPAPEVGEGLRCYAKVLGAVQTTLRMGRVLPLRWWEMDYARFMLLTTLTGGWFGSRLMSNLREEKGYTYGVYARTQIYRGMILFYIATDVAGEVAERAEEEIRKELEGLVQVDEGELERVKTVLAADFVRSLDGVFERSTRFCDMQATCVTEQLTENLREALETTTAAELEELARRMLSPRGMVCCGAGV